ncbi:MAG: molybdenum enzyme, large subunit,related to phenylacetyl-CoA: acceptor oxidoreductase [Betaproteobacteria bacterium RIFCSPLOWO2_02_FULL_65_24]|nr:MAG: molybdenum enzyme, large subunit,related to phenylacetyl-CoA: acceptor oxidoreductase [Betaproteobacteria bacterium RIFCSPLOWO2_02_FULL_65_24]
MGNASTSDDAWVPSSCSLCYASCSILAHRRDGVVVKIEGNPQSVVGKGRLCGKGASGLATHYDPNRLNVPLKRTNPQKGIGIDPGWQEISWEEALGEVAGHLKRVRAEDPRKLVVMRTTTLTSSFYPFHAFCMGFGTTNSSAAGGGLHCGNGSHLISGIMHASWGILPDFQYCNYAIYFGASKGHSAGHAANSNMGMAADARARGMRMVVVDPMCNFTSAKATEWVPIRVGTDAALALAIANLLVNELGAIDAPYLKAKTNAPYLIGPDKAYVRDTGTGKPLVWDEKKRAARPFDTVDAAEMALEGDYEVQGKQCRPSFAILRRHLQKYTPEHAEEISTVPAATVRRLAEEFAREARIGSTIVIDGVTVPYRPAAAIAFRGSQGHKNSLYNFLAVDLLNHLVGAADVAGGCLGYNPACDGFPETGRIRYVPKPDPDGLMIAGSWMTVHRPYPVGKPRLPQQAGLRDMFPMSMINVFLSSADQDEVWAKLGLPYRPEVMINFGTNQLMSIGNREPVAESLKKYKFIVSIDVFMTETSEFADIVLPDCGYLETLDSRSNFPFIFSHPAGMGEWCWPIRQPVVEPAGQRRPVADVLLELADRVGFRNEVNAAYNAVLELQPPYQLEGDRKYSYTEICDHELKDKFGPERGLDWFKQHGVVKWQKKPQEVYWRAFVEVRVPIYWEWLPAMGAALAEICAPRGLAMPREYFEPVPDWLPCASHTCSHEGFDLYAFYYRDTLHTNSYTLENPWLDEAAQIDPFSYYIALNEDTGRRKGLKNGDRVWVESDTGRRVQGRVRLTQAIHPEGLGVGACAGHWTDGMPVAKGKGVRFNDLLELDWQHSSPANLNLDLCAKVRITPA